MPSVCAAVLLCCSPTGHEGKVTGLVLLPNELVLSCSEDRTLRVWDLKTMKQLHVSALAARHIQHEVEEQPLLRKYDHKAAGWACAGSGLCRSCYAGCQGHW